MNYCGFHSHTTFSDGKNTMEEFVAQLSDIELATLVCGVQTNSVKVEAASQYYGDYFGMGFDYIDWGNMEVSNGWSNGGMFDCTWSSNNVQCNNGLLNLSINRNWNGYTGGEYRTKQSFGYGMYDVRMKPAKNDGMISIFNKRAKMASSTRDFPLVTEENTDVGKRKS